MNTMFWKAECFQKLSVVDASKWVSMELQLNGFLGVIQIYVYVVMG